jgi:UDP-2,4-diacetamido-2,4,6-trideoxy-beta-L-altropyranose hydrolase
MIIFRTDANETIATGHLMRCLAIACECRRQTEVCFVFADEKSAELLQKLCPTWQDYQIEILHTPFDRPDEEITAFTEIITQNQPTSTMIDSYYVTPAYLTAVSQHTRTFYLDDLKAFDYPVARIIHYNDDPQYTPLREQFRDVQYEVREKVSDILVTTGGSDETGMSEKIITAAQTVLTKQVNATPATLHLVLGVLNQHRDRLRELAAANQNIIIHENIPEMAALMSKCDLAVSAAGSTLCELCAVGVPTICFTTAANQIPNAERLAAQHAVLYAKDKQFEAPIETLIADYPRRRTLSANMRQIIDGHGAIRIAEEMLKNC